MRKNTRNMSVLELADYQIELKNSNMELLVLEVLVWALNKIPEREWNAKNIKWVCEAIASKTGTIIK